MSEKVFEGCLASTYSWQRCNIISTLTEGKKNAKCLFISQITHEEKCKACAVCLFARQLMRRKGL